LAAVVAVLAAGVVELDAALVDELPHAATVTPAAMMVAAFKLNFVLCLGMLNSSFRESERSRSTGLT
jgi:hypothetical protein